VVNAVVEHVRQRKPPAALAEELGPVLAEEATDFTIKWVLESCVNVSKIFSLS
jgi:hypothetical protein